MIATRNNEQRLRHIATAAALVFGVFLTRWSWRSHVLYHWDSVQFALALDDFDIRLNQPQPPGYLLYVLMGRAVRALTGLEANPSMILLSLIFTAVSAVFLYRLAERLYGYGRACLVTVFWLVSPLVWFYGEVALPHLGSAMLALMVAWWGMRSRDENPNWIFASALALGVLGAFRQQDAVFMFPLWLWFAWPLGGVRLVSGIGVMAAPSLAALAATAMASGGWTAWREIMAGYRGAAFETSIFHGAGLGGLRHNGSRVARAVAVLVGFGVLLPFLRLRFRRSVSPSCAAVADQFFLAVWVLPGLLFFLTIHMGQPGLLLFLAPGIGLLLFSLLPSRPLSRVGRAVMAGVLIANGAVFLAMPNSRDLLGRDIDWFPFLSNVRLRETAIKERLERLGAMDLPEGALLGTGYFFRHASYYMDPLTAMDLSAVLAADPGGKTVSLNVSRNRKLHYRVINVQDIADGNLVPIADDASEMILWDSEFIGQCGPDVQTTELELRSGERMLRIAPMEPGRVLAMGIGRIGTLPADPQAR